MAPPPPALAPTETARLNISNLMSPPEVTLHSFADGRSHKSPQATTKARDTNNHHLLTRDHPLSPPVSPCRRLSSSSHTDVPSVAHSHVDPIIYPTDSSATSRRESQTPLFATIDFDDHRRIVDHHVRARSLSLFGGSVAPPRPEEYALALSFRSQVMKHYSTDRKAWLRKERALLEADRRLGGRKYYTIMPAKSVVAKQHASTSKSSKVNGTDRINKVQPKPAPRKTIRVGPNGAGVGPVRHTTASRRVSATPEPSTRRVVAPNREDKDFSSLPDYCPPLDSLPSRPNSLKVDWKGQPVDLSGDPHAHLLHPDEVSLAANLRLDCATYLTSKRRIFERRLQCVRTGKEFRKTDAQQACKIDVNKASKLWTAFDKVGWLSADWVRRFL